MIESLVTGFLAFLITLALIILLLPSFRAMVGKPWLDLSVFSTSRFLIWITAFVLLCGLLAGIYPSLVLSSFKPVSVLRGKFSSGARNSGLRNALVVSQFSISIILLIGSFVVHQQMKFSQTKHLGFDRQQVLVIKTYDKAGSKIDILREELKKNPSVVNVSLSTSVPGKPFNNVGMNFEGTSQWSGTNIYAVDYDFLEVMQMKMVRGRFFSPEIPSDVEAVVINESKAREVGLSSIENKRFFIWAGRKKGNLPFKVIGIIKDFHYESFHEAVKPLVMIMTPGVAGWGDAYLSIRINPGNIPATINYIEEIWDKIIPAVPFEYAFMDSIYGDLYRNEARTGKIFTIFTFFALMVACMGLTGLTSFVIEQKKKEIGIRKVLGASVNGLVLKLSGEFTRWVIAANIIAWPLAYIWMQAWLEDFAYRVELAPWMFLAAGVSVFVISALTVSVQSLRAAKTNPLESLRFE